MSQSLGTVSRSEVVAPETGNSLGRLDYLDGLRALAALYVVFTHMAGEVWSAQNNHKPVGVFAAATKWLAYGHFAVSTFIVLSGFCLMLPVVRHDGLVAGGFGVS